MRGQYGILARPTVAEMKGNLRSVAALIGVNAIVDVRYDSSAFMTSWKSIKATCLAVRKLTNEMSCPMCAEAIVSVED